MNEKEPLTQTIHDHLEQKRREYLHCSDRSQNRSKTRHKSNEGRHRTADVKRNDIILTEELTMHEPTANQDQPGTRQPLPVTETDLKLGHAADLASRFFAMQLRPKSTRDQAKDAAKQVALTAVGFAVGAGVLAMARWTIGKVFNSEITPAA